MTVFLAASLSHNSTFVFEEKPPQAAAVHRAHLHKGKCHSHVWFQIILGMLILFSLSQRNPIFFDNQMLYNYIMLCFFTLRKIMVLKWFFLKTLWFFKEHYQLRTLLIYENVVSYFSLNITNRF